MLQTIPSEIPMGPLEGARLPDVMKNNPRFSQAASKLRSQFRQWRQGSGVTDQSLLREAAAEFAVLRKSQHLARENVALKMKAKENEFGPRTPGVIVLAMHRSGTSMLSGLLVNGIGYNVGGPLIGAAFDNEKGFFERLDLVLQNDEFLRSQQMWWGGGVRSYDSDKAYNGYKSGSIKFTEGSKGLDFLGDTNNAPWLQKDPRMCITLRTWLRIMGNLSPAIIFTYRHPMEVAISLKKREDNFPLELGLRLWIIYNMRAIQNSAGLCRVVTTNENILKNPLQEIQYIADELKKKCNMPAGPNRISQEQVDQFIDRSLQHNKLNLLKEERILENIEDNNNCKLKDYVSDYERGSEHYERELSLYRTAMKIFCDLDSKEAFKEDYQWPVIPK
mmetsp:Transcript_12263/g.14053  ORF Transcript_12263/g.14053 Transcript_12263/m.14053 type:complete len:390 (-) Transcript_12263:103-1272(-)|eukprot:CAMPEP_0194184120 /NCGR_PEP_ID=MMETSP0154-20130528/35902_1 /TAXON_ID=1049557 /ORGANISM="Thalassiothrix antarctica, Strain L6-D1" /LENGTH=389 /DNA_ID=CAMNT_0038901537 /DNA_START=1 /DNA_END=1170 /DNA_ORIENTATION=-